MALFGKSKPQPPSAQAAYRALLADALGTAWLRQLDFGEQVVQGRNWNVDFGQGLIYFGEDAYPVQFLGSESEQSNTWLWGFANPSGFAPELMRDVETFYRFCLQQGCRELEPAELPLDALVNGHNLAMIAACNQDDGACYYRCPYPGGAAYVLVKGLPAQLFAPQGPERVVEALRQLLGEFDLEHRAVVEGLLRHQQAQLQEEEAQLCATFPGGSQLRISFDELGRVSGIRGELSKPH